MSSFSAHENYKEGRVLTRNGSSSSSLIVEEEEEYEWLMESDTNRRVLLAQIDYDSLKPNKPVCNTPNGQSYDCVHPVNPLKRPCNKYYRCDRTP
ncbi:hypothetical protein QJS04_geneDACA023256 [Acorus gramineus]|uniref:Uncharacterized protein n=1 Tax=Acorus gramineus TaxID=55184 RepID=A0AAV9A5R8_ACOGR|nr:hypothetical protein QJS04_geneDACA023256 [Acorus gramineus]